MKDKGSLYGWLAASLPLLLLTLLAVAGLLNGTSPDLILKQFGNPDTVSAIFVSLRTTAVSIILIAVFGSFLALALSKSKGIGASILEMVVTLPTVLPPSVAGLALLSAFGRQGLLGGVLEGFGVRLAFTPTAVVLSQVLVAAPFFVREAAVAFRSIPGELVDAAKLDGATNWQLGSRLVLPYSAPFLATGLILAWTRSLGEFGATIMFAGNMPGVTQSMPLAVYLGFESSIEEAKALSVILLVIAVVVLVTVRMILGRRLSFAH